jgi:predicted lipoprotein with Yx(FWY)xxD motif
MRGRTLRVRLAAMVVVTGFGVAAAVATAALVSVHSTQNSALGVKILVSASGRTLYHPSSDKKTVVKCIGPCAKEWPPLLVAAGAKAIAGPGVTASSLGTVKRPDGKLQVTYHGLTLYLFSGDRKAGDVKGQGDDGIWHALAPSGAIVTKVVKTSTGTGSGTTSGSGSGTTSGSGSGTTSGSGSGSGGTTTTPTDCATNPGGYGCM